MNEEEMYQAFVWFLKSLMVAKTVADVNVSAGALLQDLGELKT